jgi:drug/metabolite transporter superfamily protein YnfA
MLLSDISTGNTATADVLFLLAAIAAGLAVIVHLIPPGNPPRPYAAYGGVLVALALCLGFIGWLVL